MSSGSVVKGRVSYNRDLPSGVYSRGRFPVPEPAARESSSPSPSLFDWFFAPGGERAASDFQSGMTNLYARGQPYVPVNLNPSGQATRTGVESIWSGAAGGVSRAASQTAQFRPQGADTRPFAITPRSIQGVPQESSLLRSGSGLFSPKALMVAAVAGLGILWWRKRKGGSKRRRIPSIGHIGPGD